MLHFDPSIMNPVYTCIFTHLDCLRQAGTPALHPHHAQHTVQSGVCVAHTLFYPPSRAPRVFAGGLQTRAEREAASEIVVGVISR